MPPKKNVEALVDQHFEPSPRPSPQPRQPQQRSREFPPPNMPPMPAGNPLARYFRPPGVHVKLPTNGAFLPPGSVDFSMNREVAVYPMRAADEILLKSPDALMNGFAIEKLLESCVPAIKTPRLISSPDLDVLLVAIKAVTTGDIIRLNTECPACKAENEYHRSLSELMSTQKPVPAENMIRLSDEITVYIRPYNLESATRLGIASFEETRRLQALEAAEADQTVRAVQVGESMGRLSKLFTETLADCILRVVVPEGEVTDKRDIFEFINNISKAWTDKISDMLEQINKLGIEKQYDVKCASCGHEWEAAVEFDPATFFGNDSSAS